MVFVWPGRFMFDFDVGKLLIFGIVALAVIPPKDLPRVMRTVGQTIGKMRRMAAEFQGQFMDAMKEIELESVKQELENVKKEFAALEESTKADSSFDPAMAMRQEMTHAIEGPKDVGVSEVALNEGVAEAPQGASEIAQGVAAPGDASIPAPMQAPMQEGTPAQDEALAALAAREATPFGAPAPVEAPVRPPERTEAPAVRGAAE
jgi:sec-independent protein translocase protein TatB